MTENGPEEYEKTRVALRNARLKNVALVIGSIAALTASGTSMCSSLGLDKLIANKHADQTETSKKSYKALSDSNIKLRDALLHAFERIRSLESRVRDIKEDNRVTMWMRLSAHRGTTAVPAMPPPPSPEPEAAPPMTSDPEALFGASGPGILSTLLGKPKDAGLKMLEDSAPPEWEQVQAQETQ